MNNLNGDELLPAPVSAYCFLLPTLKHEHQRETHEARFHGSQSKRTELGDADI